MKRNLQQLRTLARVAGPWLDRAEGWTKLDFAALGAQITAADAAGDGEALQEIGDALDRYANAAIQAEERLHLKQTEEVRWLNAEHAAAGIYRRERTDRA